VRQAFLDMAAAEPNRWLVIDARQSVEQMQEQIQARVSQLLSA
jgi:dTMP kinase